MIHALADMFNQTPGQLFWKTFSHVVHIVWRLFTQTYAPLSNVYSQQGTNKHSRVKWNNVEL